MEAIRPGTVAEMAAKWGKSNKEQQKVSPRVVVAVQAKPLPAPAPPTSNRNSAPKQQQQPQQPQPSRTLAPTQPQPPSSTKKPQYYSSRTPTPKIDNLTSMDELVSRVKSEPNIPNLWKKIQKAIAPVIAVQQSTSASQICVAYAICRWMGYNIAYDIKSLHEGTVTSEKCEPTYVLQKGMAVCSGYSRLYSALCSEAGLQVRNASGWAKGASYTPGDAMLKNGRSTNHEWNLLKTSDNNEYLIDVTWASGHTNGRGFVREWQSHYFLTPPQKFALDHLPEHDYDQLLEQPMSIEQYASIPHIRAPFWAAMMSLKSRPTVIVEITRGTEVADVGIEFEFGISPQHRMLGPSLHKPHGASDGIGTTYKIIRDKTGTCVTVVFKPTKALSVGDYVVCFFAMHKDDKMAHGCCEYLLRVKSPIPQPKKLFCDGEM